MIPNHKLIDEFLEAIFPLPHQFGIVWNNSCSPMPENLMWFENEIQKVDPAASISCGVSKMVIISPSLKNVVIKIPFNGCYTLDEDTNDIIWSPFNRATGADCTDYCLTEFEKYAELKTRNLECFVANTIFYKTFQGIRIFLQEKVTPYYNFCLTETSKPSKNSEILACRWMNSAKYYYYINTDWVAQCIDRYGESKVKRFLYYCNNVDLDILDDMHEGNFGYRRDESPCLLDFSNYHG